MSERTHEERRALGAGIVAGLAALAVLVVARALSPDDLDAFDQSKQALYVVDAWQNGRWLVPMEAGTIYPTKPPLMTWLSLLVSLAEGRPSELAARAPALLGGVVLVLATAWASRRLGTLACVVSSVACATSVHVIKIAWLARTDALLAAFTTLAVHEAFESWLAHRDGDAPRARRRFLFASVLAGVGTVAKSPVALACPILAIGLFLSSVRDGRYLATIGARALVRGALVYVVIVGAWLVPAALTAGEPFVRTLVDELVGHTVGTGIYASHEKTRPFWYPLTHLLGKFLPWTLVLCVAPFAWLARAREPDALASKKSDDAALAERFAACALAGTLAFFALLRVKRPDHVVPSYPWAAVVVGGAVARWSRAERGTAPIGLALALTGACTAAATLVLPLAASGRRVLAHAPPRFLRGEDGGDLVRLLLSLEQRPALLVALAALAAPIGLATWAGARRRSLRLVATGATLAAMLGCAAFFGAFAPAVTSNKARAVAAFGDEARVLAGERPVAFHRVPPSACFYLARSQPVSGELEEVERALATGPIGIVTDDRAARLLRERHPELVPVAASPFYWKSRETWQLVLLLPGDPGRAIDPGRGAGRIWW